MSDIDFDTIKKHYDLARMIETETGQQVSYGKKIRCVFHDDSTPSMVVYPDGHYHCFGCGEQGDLFDFLGRLWDCDLRTVIDRLNEPGFAATIRYIPPQAKSQTTLRPTLDSALVDQYEDRCGQREYQWWRSQGITIPVLAALRIGWTGRRWSFPWFYRGILTAFKLRRDDELTPELEPKYISAKGSRFTAPYNIDAVLDGAVSTVAIFEDEQSVMAALQCRVTGISCPANAFNPEWVNLLSDAKRIIVVADNDDPGLASAERIRKLIRRSEVIVAPDGKDAFDYYRILKSKIGDFEVTKTAFRDWLNV